MHCNEKIQCIEWSTVCYCEVSKARTLVGNALIDGDQPEDVLDIIRAGTGHRSPFTKTKCYEQWISFFDRPSNLASTPPPLAKDFLQYIFLVEAGSVHWASESASSMLILVFFFRGNKIRLGARCNDCIRVSHNGSPGPRSICRVQPSWRQILPCREQIKWKNRILLCQSDPPWWWWAWTNKFMLAMFSFALYITCVCNIFILFLIKVVSVN